MQTSSQHITTINGIPFIREGQGAFRGEPCTQKGIKPYKPPPLKSDVKRDIYNAVYHSDRALSRLEIAQKIGRVKSTWLQDQIEMLVARGSLIRIETVFSSRRNKYYYEVAR